MGRVLWLVAGLVVGISMGRNSQPFSGSQTAAVIVLVVLAAALSWWSCRRQLRHVVAAATATAVATARVDFEAQLSAQAVAMQQVVVHPQSVTPAATVDVPSWPHSVSVGQPAGAPIAPAPTAGDLEHPVTSRVTVSPAWIETSS
jgi:hypothetical protein